MLLKRKVVFLAIGLSFDSLRLLPDKPLFGLAIGLAVACTEEWENRLSGILQRIGASVR